MKLPLHILFFLLLSTVVTASKIDAVDDKLAVILKMPNDSNKVKSLNDVAFEYRNFNPEKTVSLAKKALVLGQEIGYEWDLSRSLNFIGVGYQKLGEQNKALDYYMEAERLALDIERNEQLAYAYHNMGTIYSFQNNYVLSAELFYKSLTYFEKLGELSGIAYARNSLSTSAMNQGDFDAAVEHANIALSIRKELGDKRGEGSSNNRLGEIFIKKGEYETALTYFKNNISLYRGLDNFEDLARTNLNIAKVYLSMKRYNKAMAFSEKCFQYYDDIGNDGVVAEVLLLMAQINFQEKDFTEARRFCEKVILLAKENNRQEVLVNTFLLLSELEEAKMNYAQSLMYHKRYVSLKDSLFNVEIFQQVGIEAVSFEAFKQEQENKLLKEKQVASEALIQKQRLQKWSLIWGMILFFALVLVLVRSNRRKRIANLMLKEQNRKIEEQKEAISQQAVDLEKAKEQLKDYSEDLERMVEERTIALQKSNEELELYAYMASHDLKQPLRNIAGFSQLINKQLRKQIVKVETVLKYSDIIVDSTKYMHHLIEDLLTFSRFSSSQHDNNFEVVAYQTIIDNVLQNLNQQIKDKKAKIELRNIPEKGVGIEIKLTQLFQNLISNALKFSKKDIPAEILIDAKDVGSHFEFSIKDNGIGIKEKHFDLIFETFKKLHNKREYSGVGLGLSTCKKIVKEHGGTISLKSVMGEGTTFYFTIKKVNDTKNTVNHKEMALME